MGEKETMSAGALARESPTRASTGREASEPSASERESPPGAVQYRESDFDFASRESPATSSEGPSMIPGKPTKEQ